MIMIDRAFGLSTDLYELAMAAAYFENDFRNEATFELFVRRLPKNRSYLIVAGLEQAIDYLAELHFTSDQIDYLREHAAFKDVKPGFFDYLATFKFTGDVWAMPEGTAAFPMEPLLRVTAPIIEAQIVETFLLATLNFQTLIASKAARIVTAARGRNVIEFGTRRAHGTEAGLLAARAAYIGGCIGTSNVEAGHIFGVPTFGTLAHSFVMSFDKEDEAFRAFLKVFPRTATMLVDTYDTIAAVRRLARDFGATIPSVRLDSGDLLELSIRVREILDRADMTATKIFASGDLNEYRIAELIEKGARIDSFGVGTELATSFDAPALSAVYKLVALEKNGKTTMRMKLSTDKATYPGAKQVWRLTGANNRYAQDLVAMGDEPAPANVDGAMWKPLLEQAMQKGHPVKQLFANDESSDRKKGAAREMVVREMAAGEMREARLALLNEARARAEREVEHLPDELLALEADSHYPVKFSDRLTAERDKLQKAIEGATD